MKTIGTLPVTVNEDMSLLPKYEFIDSFRMNQGNNGASEAFAVHWILNRFCNYNCSYCWPEARKDSKDFLTLDQYKLIADNIFMNARKKGLFNVAIWFVGGEVLYNPHFIDLFKYLGENFPEFAIEMQITTNFSRQKSFFKELADIAKAADEDRFRLRLSASYHGEFANEDSFLEKLLFCVEVGFRLTTSFVCNARTFDEYYRIAKRYNEAGVPAVLALDTKHGDNGLTQEQIGQMVSLTKVKPILARNPSKAASVFTLNSHPFRAKHRHEVEMRDRYGVYHYVRTAQVLNTLRLNKFTGWLCDAGRYGMRILENGDVNPASAPCKVVKMGNILDEPHFTLPEDPMMCTWALDCRCRSALSVQKYRKTDAHPVFRIYKAEDFPQAEDTDD